MKVLVNGTTLQRGGALQAFTSFVDEALRAASTIKWVFAVSHPAYQEISRLGVDDEEILVIQNSPAKNVRSRQRLRALEEQTGADVVFTFFGPSYVRFCSPHLCGVANAWVTHPSSIAYRSLGPSVDLLKTSLRARYRAWWFSNADAWVLETNTARSGLAQRFGLPMDRMDVVPNSCGSHYLAAQGEIRIPVEGERIRILCMSADYPHKNLAIIPFVARAMREQMPRLQFEFVVTLLKGSPSERRIARSAAGLGVEEFISNMGPVSVSDGPALYKSCHICFLPSLLETFSANYPEAMAIGLPIVTTDLDFAKDVCKNAALYYEPTNAATAASAILRLLADHVLWSRSVKEGKRVLSCLPTPSEKFERYREAICKLHKMGKRH